MNMKKTFFALAVLTLLNGAVLTPWGLGAVTLEECYRLARENYPMVRQYDLVQKLEKFSFTNAVAGYLPQVQLSGQATWQTDAVNFPEEMQKLYKSAGLDLKGISKDQYKVTLLLSQTLWDGGAASAKKAGAKAGAELSTLNIEKEMEGLKGRINQVYFGILALEENLASLCNSQELLRRNLEVALSGEKNGVVMRSDIDRIRVESLQLGQKCTEIEKTIEIYRSVLSLMTGREIGKDEPLEMPAVPAVDKSRNGRIELKIFDAQMNQARARKKTVNSYVTPRFDVFAQGWYGKPGLNMFQDMMEDRMSWNAVVGVKMQWNISALWTRRNNIRSIDAQTEMIGVQKDAFLWNIDLQTLQIEKEVDKMAQLQESDREIVSLRRSIREASESKYRNGVITINELLQDITEENNAVQQESIHSLDMLRNIYDLKITLGQ